MYFVLFGVETETINTYIYIWVFFVFLNVYCVHKKYYNKIICKIGKRRSQCLWSITLYYTLSRTVGGEEKKKIIINNSLMCAWYNIKYTLVTSQTMAYICSHWIYFFFLVASSTEEIKITNSIQNMCVWCFFFFYRTDKAPVAQSEPAEHRIARDISARRPQLFGFIQ